MSSRKADLDRIRDSLRRAASESGLTLEQIGVAMGYSRGGARQAVSRLLNSTADHDPRLSTLLSFARAVCKPLSDLIGPHGHKAN
jgi:hypothetical protein